MAGRRWCHTCGEDFRSNDKVYHFSDRNNVIHEKCLMEYLSKWMWSGTHKEYLEDA